MEENLIELFALTLLVFGIVGSCSVLVDLDHVWGIREVDEPINISGLYRRAFHNPIFYIIISGIVSGITVTFIYGWFVRFLVNSLGLRGGEGKQGYWLQG